VNKEKVKEERLHMPKIHNIIIDDAAVNQQKTKLKHNSIKKGAIAKATQMKHKS
jgi:hypothetical protein